MSNSAMFPYGENNQFQCECTAHLTVHITKQDGHNETEEFYCPRCGKDYKARASMPISDIQITPPLLTDPLDRKMEISSYKNNLERKVEDLSVEVAQMDQRRETLSVDEQRYMNAKESEIKDLQAQINRLKNMFARL
ncbi:hypothetical protein [Bdellovibrio sp. BCCA]|uniref:hypothetical protein n=1 Tax=Bdellovibrio sp. BCCA TaxID=3136281 RepID=UPI0030F361AB